MRDPDDPQAAAAHDRARNVDDRHRGAAGGLDRRAFLQRGASAALGVSALSLGEGAFAAAPATGEPRIKRYNKLGKTGLEVADIGFGSGGCRTADLVRHCYDHGQNYFDTAEMYKTEGWAKGDFVENVIGEALQGKRDKVVMTTKFAAKTSHTRFAIMHELEKSLRRLRTDYVDIFLNHAVNEVARMKSQEWQEFVALAKKQGKIRFSGMSGHGGNLQECLDYVIDHDLADVILCSHNFGTDPAFYERFTKHFDMLANQKGITRIFEKAHAKGIGVIAMKTLMGAKINDLSRYQKDGASLPGAAFRWVLSNPNVDSLIVSMKNRKLADEYMSYSGSAEVAQADIEVLQQYVADNSSDYCRNDCNGCESSCPHGVPIADVLRQRMYEKRYCNPVMARQGYASLGAPASACAGCSGEPCRDACAFDLDIPKLARETDRLLS